MKGRLDRIKKIILFHHACKNKDLFKRYQKQERRIFLHDLLPNFLIVASFLLFGISYFLFLFSWHEVLNIFAFLSFLVILFCPIFYLNIVFCLNMLKEYKNSPCSPFALKSNLLVLGLEFLLILIIYLTNYLINTFGYLWCFAVLIYFYPSIKAGDNNHKDLKAIFVLNLFLGWTFFGWVVALVWAVKKFNSNTKNSAKN